MEESRSSLPIRIRPFVKWAGSKRLVINHILSQFPINYNRYFEPFIGGGSIFFHLQPKEAVIGDICSELINAYKVLSVDANQVIRYLRQYSGSQSEFYFVRENRSNGCIKNAAEFIYLNKVCWNGLYRVNNQGKFNVPYGRFKAPLTFDFRNIRNCSKALNSRVTKIVNADFESIVKEADKHDLIYFDPPYVTKHNHNGFIEYNEDIFSWADQLRLAETVQMLKKRGCFVVVSNANHESIERLYKGSHIVKFERSNTLASDPKKRGRVSELIIY